jgi:hypothetical protein
MEIEEEIDWVKMIRVMCDLEKEAGTEVEIKDRTGREILAAIVLVNTFSGTSVFHVNRLKSFDGSSEYQVIHCKGPLLRYRRVFRKEEALAFSEALGVSPVLYCFRPRFAAMTVVHSDGCCRFHALKRFDGTTKHAVWFPSRALALEMLSGKSGYRWRSLVPGMTAPALRALLRL